MNEADNEGATRVIEISREIDVAWCSRVSMIFAKAMGFEGNALWGIAIAASEMASNVIKFAGRGKLTVRRILSPRVGIELKVEDRGPGIEDPDAVLVDGYSEGRHLPDEEPRFPRRGLGTGLGAVQRLTNTMSLDIFPEGGTRIIARKWLKEPGDLNS